MVTLVIWDSPLIKHLCLELPKALPYYTISSIVLLNDALSVKHKKY